MWKQTVIKYLYTVCHICHICHGSWEAVFTTHNWYSTRKRYAENVKNKYIFFIAHLLQEFLQGISVSVCLGHLRHPLSTQNCQEINQFTTISFAIKAGLWLKHVLREAHSFGNSACIAAGTADDASKTTTTTIITATS